MGATEEDAPARPAALGSRPPRTRRSRRREEAGNFPSRSALKLFALNGVTLKSESLRTMFARSSAMMGWTRLINASAALSVMTRT